VLASFLLAEPATAEIRQVWAVQVGVGEEGGPCDQAAVGLSIHDSEGKVIHKHVPSLLPQVLGIAILEMPVVFPEPGPYVLHAEFTGCDGSTSQANAIPMQVSGVDETRAIQIYGSGSPDEWQFEYFGVTSEASGEAVFSIERTDPPTIRNLLSVDLRPCRMSLFPQIEVMELIGTEWSRHERFEFPKDTKALAPGGSVKLQRPSIFVKRYSPEPEPDPTAYTIVLRVLPPVTVFQYFVSTPGLEHDEPFPGSCDVYFLPYEPTSVSK